MKGFQRSIAYQVDHWGDNDDDGCPHSLHVYQLG